MTTFLVGPEEFAGAEVSIEGDAYRHLFRSRRLAAGATLRVVDGEGRARWGEVTRVDRRQGVVVLGEEAPTNEPRYRLHLVVGALRPERASWLVEKATEIGVAAITFFSSERSPRQYGPAQLERLRRVARAAVEQCHRARVPEVSGVCAWKEMRSLLVAEHQGPAERFVLLAPEARPPNPVSEDPSVGSRARGREPKEVGFLVVGPEGGFSEQEVVQLLADRACRPIALGPRVLRVETAAVVGASGLLLSRGASW